MEAQKNHDKDHSLEVARNVFQEQAKSLQTIGESLNGEIILAVDLMHGCKGKVIISGMGKSGIIGRKIAATLASTGTPSFFVHPGEAYHGDLGMIGADDLVILVSYSGETDEVVKLLPYIRHIEARSVAITGNNRSTFLCEVFDGEVILDSTPAKLIVGLIIFKSVTKSSELILSITSKDIIPPKPIICLEAIS